MQRAESAHELFERGNSLFGAGDRTAAAACYQRALQIDPALSAASFNLGCTMDALAGPAQALPHFQQTVALSPDWWQARSNLGLALARVGRMAEAAAQLACASELNPADAGIRNNLGLALTALGKGEEAHASFLESIRLDPQYPEAHNNIAILFERYGRVSEASAACEAALALRPDYPEAHHNLGNALKSQGRHQEAIAHYREALRLRPDAHEMRSALLFALCYPATPSEEQIVAEHAAFGAACRFAASHHDNVPDPERVLRIGYVSGDLRDHAVARFIEPVLRHHDRTRFEVTCYCNVQVADATSALLGELAGREVNLSGMPDDEAAQLIRRDRIDILVDLSGHTADNRLLLFARKPAPVQVSWLGYPATTGLDAIDYRLTDPICDPPGATERFYSERLLRLPETFSCFAPPEAAPPVAALPAAARGYVTFGSFNNPAKITPEAVELWAGALTRVPGARMLIKGYSLADAQSRERLLWLFAEHGISGERLELRGNTVSYAEHLALYGDVDIALDSYPYHGTTTTCEALWMGVPVVTLAGSTHRSRVGATLLGSTGLRHLVAANPQEFADKAAQLAGDPEALAQLRAALRGTMAASPLTDGARFTKNLEAAFSGMWESWCAEQPHPSDRIDRTDRTDRTDPFGPTGQTAAQALACATQHLQQGRLDQALGGFLAALNHDPACGDALGGIEAVMSRQATADLAAASRRDAARLGVATPGAAPQLLQSSTLEQTAALLLARGLLTPAELICRYLMDRGYRGLLVSRTLGEIALSLGQPARAADYFRDALAQGDGRQSQILLLKAEQFARLQPKPHADERFLLIKAWGYGFWSDVNHLLGQCLLAEMTGRIPVVHWGGNSLFSDAPTRNAFDQFFEPVSDFQQRDLPSRCRSCYPPKWNAGNLTMYGINQAAGPWSRCSSLHALARPEDVVVSDFHYSVHDLVPWIAPEHRLYGLSTDEIYQYLFRHYLKVRPAIMAKAEAFFREHLAGGQHLALHVRGGDKGGEDPNLALLNSLYPIEIERHFEQYPDARLFLITDDVKILASYRERYGERVITTSAVRTCTEQGVHYQNQSSRYRLGEEVLVDALLATRCEQFIGNGLSNVSCSVAQMRAWPEGSCRLLGARLDRIRNFTLYRS